MSFFVVAVALVVAATSHFLSVVNANGDSHE